MPDDENTPANVAPPPPRPRAKSRPGNIRVAVRVRPLDASSGERDAALAVRAGTIEVASRPPNAPRRYPFDAVFGERDDTASVYEATVRESLAFALRGYTLTVMLYGQTASGKTYTTQGLLRRAVGQIFERVDDVVSGRAAGELEADGLDGSVVSVTYIELYAERAYDLLKSGRPEVAVPGAPGARRLAAATQRPAACADEMLALLEGGSALRSVSATSQNERSSRSHAIVTVEVNMFRRGSPDDGSMLVAKFHLVDLAGNERFHEGTGQSRAECKAINQSLLALTRCTSILSEGRAGAHVPYNESALTRFLRDSLGGPAQTQVIACVHPAAANGAQTESTLKYASKMSRIKNRVRRNTDTGNSAMAKLRKQLSSATQALDAHRQAFQMWTSALAELERVASSVDDEEAADPRRVVRRHQRRISTVLLLGEGGEGEGEADEDEEFGGLTTPLEKRGTDADREASRRMEDMVRRLYRAVGRKRTSRRWQRSSAGSAVSDDLPPALSAEEVGRLDSAARRCSSEQLVRAIDEHRARAEEFADVAPAVDYRAMYESAVVSKVRALQAVAEEMESLRSANARLAARLRAVEARRP